MKEIYDTNYSCFGNKVEKPNPGITQSIKQFTRDSPTIREQLRRRCGFRCDKCPISQGPFRSWNASRLLRTSSTTARVSGCLIGKVEARSCLIRNVARDRLTPTWSIKATMHSSPDLDTTRPSGSEYITASPDLTSMSRMMVLTT